MDLLQFHQSIKPNKQPARHDKRSLLLADYTSALAPAPDTYSLAGIPNTTPTLWGNDTVGDCTKSAYAGMVYSLSTASGETFVYTDQQVLTMYEQCDGYVPGNHITDNGSDGLTTLKYLVSSGADGHAPIAYLSLNISTIDDLKIAARYFGGVYIGIQLPKAWQGKTLWGTSCFGSNLGKWARGSWGGHMIYGKARYTPDHLEILTWGATYQLTWKAALQYLDEAYAVLIPDFKSPDGFNDVQLQADLAAIRQQ
jgi:hypothetical protein